MKRYFIELAFKGTNYHGWQIQRNARTVQEEINKVLTLLLNQKINVTGAGRTDTGVHAKYFTAHFDCSSKTLDSKELVFKINRILPEDIAVYNIRPVHEDANARFDAISRTYKYYISKKKDPFTYEYTLYMNRKLDVQKMNDSAGMLSRYADFKSFSKLHSNNKTTLCRVSHAMWEESDVMLIFTIKADRFLRNMVRSIVGTLLDVGTGKIDMAGLKQIIESKSRAMAGVSVSPAGLFLEDIEYPLNYFGNFR